MFESSQLNTSTGFLIVSKLSRTNRIGPPRWLLRRLSDITSRADRPGRISDSQPIRVTNSKTRSRRHRDLSHDICRTDCDEGRPRAGGTMDFHYRVNGWIALTGGKLLNKVLQSAHRAHVSYF